MDESEAADILRQIRDYIAVYGLKEDRYRENRNINDEGADFARALDLAVNTLMNNPAEEMNDRYLFRGKPTLEFRTNNPKAPQWAIGSLHINPGGEYAITDYQSSVTYPVDSRTIGQCTGVRNRLGNLIFEGDLCRDVNRAYAIQWNYTYMRFVCIDIDKPYNNIIDPTEFRFEYAKIVGNIHDNPGYLR
jgi:hypothetical protein